MSYPPSYPQPQYPPAAPLPPVPRPPWVWIGTGLAALAIVVAGVVAAVVLTGKDEPSRVEQALAEATQDPAPTTEATTTEPAPVVTPSLSAIRLTPKILDKHCFGSAGCNVEFEIDMSLGVMVTGGTVWRVTYEVTGVEDAPVIGSFELDDSSYDRVTELVQTASSKAKIKIRATEIELLSS